MRQQIRYFQRARNMLRRGLIQHLGRRPFVKTTLTPYISFSFDDFPRSAYLYGAPVLESYGARGTFNVCMGLLNRHTDVGTIASIDNIKSLIINGHEIGCHTYDHQDGCLVSTETFVRSVKKNQAAFSAAFSNQNLCVFAYPLDGPTLRTKLIIGRRFLCCRGGGQTFNDKSMDLNLLKAFFLDWRSHNKKDAIRQLIDQNNSASGWLIFVTHDVESEPTRYGCTPAFFEAVVSYATRSGARILPIGQGCSE